MEDIGIQNRSLLVPSHKIRRLKQEWLKIYMPVVQLGKLEIRFNHKSSHVEVRTCSMTEDLGFLERSITYIQAVVDGFKPEDAIAIMKFKDVCTDSFQIQDVRKLKNGHLSRAIGRIIGRDGRIKESIENFSRCKFILQDERVFLLGSEENIKIARDAIGRLIQGAEPTSIFNRLRIISAKLKDKYGSIQTIYSDLRKSYSE